MISFKSLCESSSSNIPTTSVDRSALIESDAGDAFD